MRQIVYWPNAKRLVYLEGKATPQFWDHRWQAEGKPGPVNLKDEVVTVTEKYLPRGARLLEGGCGRANKLKAISAAGYPATGVDFAQDTVRQARLHYPDLDIRQGDVRSLDFPDGSFRRLLVLGRHRTFLGGLRSHSGRGCAGAAAKRVSVLYSSLALSVSRAKSGLQRISGRGVSE